MWSVLGTQFCLQIAFGVLAALAFVPKAPVGTLFYRILGTSALVPILAAIAVPISTGDATWTDPPILAAGLAALAYPIYAGPVRGGRWAAGLAVGLLGCAVAVVLTLRTSSSVDTGGGLALASATALATGTVAGSVGLAMVLGHWYLTIPNLQVRHLVRLNRVTVGSMGLSLLFLVVSCLAWRASLESAELFEATGLFYLGTRVVVGLVLPLVFAWMVAGSLAVPNTRSATGILYASTVLVLIGTAVSVSLQESYGVPL